jgi:hypothetical protein
MILLVLIVVIFGPLIIAAVVANHVYGPDPDLKAPWDPQENGYSRCGGDCPNPHPARPWMDRGMR